MLIAAHAQAQLRPQPPVLGSVTDELGVLSSQEGGRLADALGDILERTRVRVIMVIVRTTWPETIEDYGERLAQRWRAERHVDPTRIVMVLLATDDREMQLMPGRALGIDDAMLREDPRRPPLGALLKEQRYADALMMVAARIESMLERNRPQPNGGGARP